MQNVEKCTLQAAKLLLACNKAVPLWHSELCVDGREAASLGCFLPSTHKQLVPTAVDPGGESQTGWCFMPPAFSGRLAENKARWRRAETRDARGARREMTTKSAAARLLIFHVPTLTQERVCSMFSASTLPAYKVYIYMWLMRKDGQDEDKIYSHFPARCCVKLVFSSFLFHPRMQRSSLTRSIITLQISGMGHLAFQLKLALCGTFYTSGRGVTDKTRAESACRAGWV